MAIQPKANQGVKQPQQQQQSDTIQQDQNWSKTQNAGQSNAGQMNQSQQLKGQTQQPQQNQSNANQMDRNSNLKK